MKLATFLEKASNAKLAQAVIDQLGGWEEFSERASDISNYGIDGGFGGFIYYNETVAFALANYDEIHAALKEDKEDFGAGSVGEMLSSWKSLKGIDQDDIAEVFYSKDEDHDEYTNVFNALAWYAGTKIAYEYVNMEDDGEQDEDDQGNDE